VDTAENTKRYRFFGIELRMVFWLVAVLFLLAAAVGFRNSICLSMLFLVILIVLVFFIRWDASYHLVIITSDKLVFEKIIWRRLSTSFVYVQWSDVERITTVPYGIFSLLKSTQIQGKGQSPILVYSFMEDYLHFLKDLTSQAKSAQVDKLTLDLLAGRADV